MNTFLEEKLYESMDLDDLHENYEIEGTEIDTSVPKELLDRFIKLCDFTPCKDSNKFSELEGIEDYKKIKYMAEFPAESTNYIYKIGLFDINKGTGVAYEYYPNDEDRRVRELWKLVNDVNGEDDYTKLIRFMWHANLQDKTLWEQFKDIYYAYKDGVGSQADIAKFGTLGREFVREFGRFDINGWPYNEDREPSGNLVKGYIFVDNIEKYLDWFNSHNIDCEYTNWDGNGRHHKFYYKLRFDRNKFFAGSKRKFPKYKPIYD